MATVHASLLDGSSVGVDACMAMVEAAGKALRSCVASANVLVMHGLQALVESFPCPPPAVESQPPPSHPSPENERNSSSSGSSSGLASTTSATAPGHDHKSDWAKAEALVAMAQAELSALPEPYHGQIQGLLERGLAHAHDDQAAQKPSEQQEKQEDEEEEGQEEMEAGQKVQAHL